MLSKNRTKCYKGFSILKNKLGTVLPLLNRHHGAALNDRLDFSVPKYTGNFDFRLVFIFINKNTIIIIVNKCLNKGLGFILGIDENKSVNKHNKIKPVGSSCRETQRPALM